MNQYPAVHDFKQRFKYEPFHEKTNIMDRPTSAQANSDRHIPYQGDLCI